MKNEWGALPLRVRRIYRVRLHGDLPILVQLAGTDGFEAMEKAGSKLSAELHKTAGE